MLQKQKKRLRKKRADEGLMDISQLKLVISEETARQLRLLEWQKLLSPSDVRQLTVSSLLSKSRHTLLDAHRSLNEAQPIKKE